MSRRRDARGRSGAGPADLDDLLGVSPKASKSASRGPAQRRPSPPQPRASTRAPGGVSHARIGVICTVFCLFMGASLVRFADLADRREDPTEPAVAAGVVDEIDAAEIAEKIAEKSTEEAPAPLRRTLRAPIVDRHGRSLARDVATYELYVDANAFAFDDEVLEAADTIAAAFPDRKNAEALREKLMARRWGTTLVERPLTAREAQRAHDLGVPGLYLWPRYDRFYAAGAAAAHVVGSVRIDGLGQAGVEAALDARLKAAPETPVALSLDLRVQRRTAAALSNAMEETGAKAAAAVVMAADTGEILAMVSLPTFDPHHRPTAPTDPAKQEESPLFHRAVIGLYELGSVVKTITWAHAIDRGFVALGDRIPAMDALYLNDKPIGGGKGSREMTVTDAFITSSNRIAMKFALDIGRSEQARFFKDLGLLDPPPVEVGEARKGRPPFKRHWGDVDTATAGYGHGVQMTPVHLAAAVASLVNGGWAVRPTILMGGRAEEPRVRVISSEASYAVRELLRRNVSETTGSGRAAALPGIAIGGKTGTAEKAIGGAYQEDRVVSSFVAAAPIERPEVVVIATLDEPSLTIGGQEVRLASVTAAPAVQRILEGVAPLLGFAPDRLSARYAPSVVVPALGGD